MSKQKRIRKIDNYYDDRLEEDDVQAITKKSSESIYGNAAKKPWKWAEYIKSRMKAF
ncbi:MAG: hypothetical protein KAS63_02660 [Candidatus Heimdallarchaeota archaeon]|nr:hypothetical protein [Candidatus Heimdallarchaeota archaeon]MCK4954237.1 hypothetical protein [Candidatus Heimdallarchaeota archaeon]